MARTDPHFRLRIEPQLRDWVAAQAAKNRRSLTAEINSALHERMTAATGDSFAGDAPAAAQNDDRVGRAVAHQPRF